MSSGEESSVECAIKLALDFSPEDERIIEGQMKICNWLYNQLLQRANELRDSYVAMQDKNAGEMCFDT